MRFVDLKRRKNESYFDLVMKLGCGPNYVKNRSALFEQMVQEQGKEFWFRLWLSFCLQPEIKEVEEFVQELPIVTTSLSQYLHNRFVRASTEAAIAYCWNVLFEKPIPVGVSEIVVSDGQFIDGTYQFVVTHFACALGEVFYRWLRAKDMGNVKAEYWSIPRQYLEPDFKPGLLEVYMIKHWGKKLSNLLDVNKHQVPWIRRYMLSKESNTTVDTRHKYVYSHNECLRSKVVVRKLKMWAFKVKKMTKAIREVDERQTLVHQKITNDEVCDTVYRPSSEESMEPTTSGKLEKKNKRIFNHQIEVERKCKKGNNQQKLKSDHGNRKKLQNREIDYSRKKKAPTKVLDAATNTEFKIRLLDCSTNTDSTDASSSGDTSSVSERDDIIRKKTKSCSTSTLGSMTETKSHYRQGNSDWADPKHYCSAAIQPHRRPKKCEDDGTDRDTTKEYLTASDENVKAPSEKTSPSGENILCHPMSY